MSSMSPKVQNQILQLQQVQQQLQTILSQKAQFEIEIRETRRASEELAQSEADVSRRRVLIAAGVVVAVLLAVVGGWLVLGRGSGQGADASPTSSPTATGPKQPTLLVQLTDKEGVATFTPTEGNVYLIVSHRQAADQKGEGYDKTHYSATLTIAVPQLCPHCIKALTTQK